MKSYNKIFASKAKLQSRKKTSIRKQKQKKVCIVILIFT